MPTFPVTTGSVVTVALYNELADIAEEVLGIGENGYGIYSSSSTSVTNYQRIRSQDWQNLVQDIVHRCYHHQTGINTTTNTYSQLFPQGIPQIGDQITPTFANTVNQLAQSILANRFTIHESQFYRDPITGESRNFKNCVSTRTLPWGVSPLYVEHHVRIRWASRLLARYFFNLGGYLVWEPFHLDDGLSPLDAEWAVFIGGLRASLSGGDLIEYGRSEFMAQTNGTTATVATFSSSTLYIQVEVFKASSEEFVDFKITYGNTDNPQLIVTPSVGYWNELV